MKIMLAYIYLYGLLYVGKQYKGYFTKRALWEETIAHRRIRYICAVVSIITWPIQWIGGAIQFHIDQPYRKD